MNNLIHRSIYVQVQKNKKRSQHVPVENQDQLRGIDQQIGSTVSTITPTPEISHALYCRPTVHQLCTTVQQNVPGNMRFTFAFDAEQRSQTECKIRRNERKKLRKIIIIENRRLHMHYCKITKSWMSQLNLGIHVCPPHPAINACRSHSLYLSGLSTAPFKRGNGVVENQRLAARPVRYAIFESEKCCGYCPRAYWIKAQKTESFVTQFSTNVTRLRVSI